MRERMEALSARETESMELSEAWSAVVMRERAWRAVSRKDGVGEEGTSMRGMEEEREGWRVEWAAEVGVERGVGGEWVGRRDWRVGRSEVAYVTAVERSVMS